MADKILNTRIQLRCDTVEAWAAANPTLRKGELALGLVAATETAPAAVVIKCGDGTSNYNALPYVSALASDVLTACKTEAGLKTFINTVISESGIATDEALKTVSDAVALLNGTDAEVGSVANSIKTAIEALNVTDTAVEHQFITSVSENAGKVVIARAQPVVGDIDGLQTALDAKQDNLVFMTAYDATNNKVATATDLQKVADDASTEIANKISTTYKAAGSVATVDAIPTATKDTLGYVYNLTAAGVTTDAFVEGAGKSIPEGANIVVVEIPGENEGDPATYKFDVLSGMVDLSDYAKTTEVSTAITNAIQALDVADDGATGVVTKVEETDGKVAVTKTAIKDVDGFNDAVAGGVETVLTPPAEGQQPSETYTKLVESITNTVTKEIEKVPAEGATNDLAEAIKKAVDDALKDSTTPSALNTTVEGMINTKVDAAKTELKGDNATADGTGNTIADAKKLADNNKTAIDTLNGTVETAGSVAHSINAELDKLDFVDTGVEGEWIWSVSQENGKISVIRKALTTDNIEQGSNDLVLDCGGAGVAEVTP